MINGFIAAGGDNNEDWKAPLRLIKEDLDKFVEELGLGRPLLDGAIDRIESTEHAAFIKEICEYLILKKEEKVNAVMIYGAFSAGKTQFLLRLGQI